MLPKFLQTGKADETMRTVTFSLKERAVLIPLEVCMLWKKLLIALIVFFLVSGISPQIFSFAAGLARSATLLLATLTAILAGTVLTPLLLPWIPFRQFWLKGALAGGLAALLFLFTADVKLHGLALHGLEQLALWLWITACSAFLAMNFTGCTPFTSLSGVEKELRRGLPWQIAAATLALILWVAGPFM